MRLHMARSNDAGVDNALKMMEMFRKDWTKRASLIAECEPEYKVEVKIEHKIRGVLELYKPRFTTYKFNPDGTYNSTDHN